jgi:putative oxidoreductase
MAGEALMLVGRVVFGLFFLIAGVRNFAGFGKRVETSGTNYGWKLPVPLLAVGFAVQLLGGVALVIGIGVVPAVAALIVFLVLATSLFHNALMFPPGERDLHIYLVLVNVTLAGGLLMIAGAAL